MSETLHARVRRLYGYAVAWRADVPDDRPDLQEMQSTAFAEFDQLIDQVRRAAKVEALREEADDLHDLDPDGDAVFWDGDGYEFVTYWLRTRADQLEQGGKNNE